MRCTRWVLGGFLGGLLAAGLGGCIVAPVRPARVVPAGVIYVQPAYAIPGPGYVWGYHAVYGWGWHHPRFGWHRGWQ